MTLAYSQIFQQKQGDRQATVAHMAQYAALAVATTTATPALDFGCGWGHLLEALERAGTPCKGIDICEGQVDEARRHGCIAVHVPDSVAWLQAQTQQGQRWGTIFLLDVLEHLDAPQQLDLLVALHQALVPGGRLVLKCPNPDSVVGMRMAFSDYTHRFTPTFDALAAVLSSSGFSQVRAQDEFAWGEPYPFSLRGLFFGAAGAKAKRRNDAFYFLSKRVFRALRRLQIASEVGLEKARQVPLSANFLCIAER